MQFPFQDNPEEEHLQNRKMGQMPLFRTTQILPGTNVYQAHNPNRPRATSRAETLATPVSRHQAGPFERSITADNAPLPGGYEGGYKSPPFSSERKHIAGQEAYHRLTGVVPPNPPPTHTAIGLRERRDGRIVRGEKAQDVLGWDAFPEKVNPSLQFGDLTVETRDNSPHSRTDIYSTQEGTEVGVSHVRGNEWGATIDSLSVNPMYKGRGFEDMVASHAALKPGVTTFTEPDPNTHPSRRRSVMPEKAMRDHEIYTVPEVEDMQVESRMRLSDFREQADMDQKRIGGKDFVDMMRREIDREGERLGIGFGRSRKKEFEQGTLF